MINVEELIGRRVTNIFESTPSVVQDGIPGPASYFYIVIELDNLKLYELGAHQISNWKRDEELKTFENTPWAVQNNLIVLGQKIIRVIQKDPVEYYDGSLTLLLENNVYIEHQTTNGDQLFIDHWGL